MEEKIENILIKEMERLQKINDDFEKQASFEPEQIVSNVKAICEVANTYVNFVTRFTR